MMTSKNLHPAQDSELKFLRRQVDGRVEDALRSEPHSNVSQDLDRARRELKEFVEKLRRDGYNI